MTPLESEEVRRNGHRRRNLDYPGLDTKNWRVVFAAKEGLLGKCPFDRFPHKKSLIGSLFYWLGMKLKHLLLEKRYAYIG